MKKCICIIVSLVFVLSAAAVIDEAGRVRMADELRVEKNTVYVFPQDYYHYTDSWGVDVPKQFTPNTQELRTGLSIFNKYAKKFSSKKFGYIWRKEMCEFNVQAFGIDRNEGLLLLIFVPKDCYVNNLSDGIVTTSSVTMNYYTNARTAVLAVVNFKKKKLLSACPFIMISDEFKDSQK